MPDNELGGETGIIENYFTPLSDDTEGAFGLLDDAGKIRPPDGQEVVLTTDTIVSGIHYLDDAAPEDIGYKALAVNVSDLCAKGADPAVYLLSLALPSNPDPDWLQALSDGFGAAQDDFSCGLLGGDTVHTTGPVVITVTAAGFVPEGGMVHRFSANESDHVYVTGTIGDAALGLALLSGETARLEGMLGSAHSEFLKSRYWRPAPRVDAIAIVRTYASACMDISDGLAGDFGKMCASSGMGGVIQAGRIPLSPAAAACVHEDPVWLKTILSGGDDYELLLTVPPEHTEALELACSSAGVDVTCIGHICAAGEAVTMLDEDKEPVQLDRLSYDHF